ncbi:MAG: FAD-dependent oxidoreductase [Chloroflexi bacterium]|nr:FAD-dependent oxidoreductase [Chloroflexota bacterium]
MAERLIIIGGVAAGMSAAAKARRMNPALEIVVYEKSGHISYGACGFPYFIKGDVTRLEDLIARTPAQMAAQGVMAHVCHEVMAIDPAQRTVRVMDHENGRLFTDHWDKLIITTGASVNRPPIPGANLPGVFTLRTVEDALAIQRWLVEEKPKHGVIVGAGYIGLEMAEALQAHGLAVTLVEMADQVLPGLDADMAALVQVELQAHGVQICLQQPVKSFVGPTLVREVVREVAAMVQGDGGENGRLRIHEVLTPGSILAADMVVFGVGGRPNVTLAQAAGIHLGQTGAIAVDEYQRTNLPNVWAAGAAAESKHLILNKPIYWPLAAPANKQGRVAGTNAAGGQAKSGMVAGTAVVKVFDLAVGVTGLTEKQAQAAGLNAASVTIEASSRAHYMPGQSPIHLKLVYEQETERVLGAQMVGKDGIAKRIDIIAAALHANWTIHELAELDLSYAPPFAPVWDPILVAANVAKKS